MMSVKNFSDLLADNENDLDNFRGQSFQNIVFETMEDFLDGSSIGGVVFESPVLAFEGDNSEILENSIVKFFNAIIRNAISTYGQVIDFEETPNFDRMILTRVPWTNCTFLNFDKTKLERKYFFGTFDYCEFDNIDFTPRDLRITHCEVKNSLMLGDFNRTWIDQCVLENTEFKRLEFKLNNRESAQNVLFDRIFFFYKHSEKKWGSKLRKKYVTPDYTMTQLHNCHFDKILLRGRFRDEDNILYQIGSSQGIEYDSTIPTISPFRLMFPYEGLETCSFTVLLLSNSTLSSKSKWLGAALPSQIVRPNAVPKRKKTAPKESVYSSFIDFCDKEDLWYFMGFRREDLLKAKKLTFAIVYGFFELFIDASSHKDKEVLNLELLGKMNDSIIKNCKFKNMEINLRLENTQGGLNNYYLIGSTFENCTISIEKFSLANKPSTTYKGLTLMDCTFVNCTFRGGKYRPDSYITQDTVFKDCAFEDVTLRLDYHPNIKLEGTVTYDEYTDIVLHPNAPNNIEELGFTKKG